MEEADFYGANEDAEYQFYDRELSSSSKKGKGKGGSSKSGKGKGGSKSR